MSDDLLLHIFLAMLGTMFGMILLSRVLRWIHSIVQAVKSGRGSSGRTALGLTATVLLNSGPWLLVAMGLFAGYVLSSPIQSAWGWWFFGGIAIGAPAATAAVVLLFYKRLRARRSQAKSAGI